MSLISSVTSAAASIASGLDSVTAGPGRPAGLGSGLVGGLVAARKPDPLTTGAVAKTAAKAAAKATARSTAKGTAKTSGAAKAATSTTKKAASGYSKAVADDFAFLKDPALSVEEKLFRFMCAVAKRNDDEVLKKMEEMKGGAAAAAAKASSPSTAKKSSGTSVWGALKALIPPLGLAAQVVGDAKLKSLITQASGPVLSAAATALGLPMLAPLALKAGPGLASNLLDAKVGGGEPAGTKESGSSTGGATTSTGSTGTASTAKNEQVQMMELQRLVDKQKEMFAMISNVLRAQHDTRMAIIGNVR